MEAAISLRLRQTAIAAYGILDKYQKTRDPMTNYRWYNVCDAGPTLTQHWLNILIVFAGIPPLHCHNVA